MIMEEIDSKKKSALPGKLLPILLAGIGQIDVDEVESQVELAIALIVEIIVDRCLN